MMKINLCSGAFLMAIVLLAASCSKSVPKQTKYIPKDASAVFSMNPKNIFEKLDNNHVNLDSIMKAATADDTTMRWTMDDIKNSGIDLTTDVYFFVQQAGSIMSGQNTVIGFTGAMHSTSDFENFLKKKMPGVVIKKENSYSYAALKDGAVAGWNDDVALLAKASAYNMQGGGAATDESGASQKALAAYFTQKEDASIASVDAFKDGAKEKADMLLFSSSNSAMASVPMLGMSKASDLLKDLYSVSTFNFEDGKVVMDSKTYTNKVLADTLKNYAGPKVDMDMVDKYPGAVNGFAAFSFNPKLITAILTISGVTATANQGLQQLGFTIDDVTSAFKGDFAVIVSGFGMQEKSSPEMPNYKYQQPVAKIIANAAIGDKAAYDKIVKALAAKDIMVLQNGQYILKEMAEGKADGFVMSTDAKNLIVASDAALLQQYKSGTGKITLPSGIADQSKGNAVAFYADVASILNAMPPDTTDQSMMNAAKQTFKDAVLSSENISGNMMKGHLELRLVNEKENSLATLARYFGTLHTAMEKMKETAGMDDGSMSPSMSDTDSTDMVEPPIIDSAGK